jgi:Gpi18-like mannosyltransferase
MVAVLAYVLCAKVMIWSACALLAGDTSWTNAFHKWDSYWYEGLATTGYEDGARLKDPSVGQSNWAFFPLYPALVRSVGVLLRIPPAWAMEVLSWLSALGSILAVRALFNVHGCQKPRDLTVFLLWPFCLFIYVHYSDALFLALACATLVAIARKRTGLAALCSALLVLTRPNGLLFIPVVLLYHLARHPVQADGRRHIQGVRPLLLLLLAPAMTFALWCGYQWHATGDLFAFSTAQAGWGRHWSWPWESLFNSGGFAPQFESWYTLVLLFATGWYWKRLEWSFRAWLLVGIVVPMCSGSVDSMTRFAIAFVPLMLVVAQDIDRSERPVLAFGSLVVLQLIGLALWATYHPLMA